VTAGIIVVAGDVAFNHLSAHCRHARARQRIEGLVDLGRRDLFHGQVQKHTRADGAAQVRQNERPLFRRDTICYDPTRNGARQATSKADHAGEPTSNAGKPR
jgi:hypothetical protein